MAHNTNSYPPCPYVEGLELSIRPHTPSTPLEYNYQGPSEEKGLFYDGRRLEAVILYPTWKIHEDSTVDPSSKSSRHIRIKQTIVAGKQLGARIVLCTVSSADGSSENLVAKVYDPLYYRDPPKEPEPPFPEIFTVSLNINAGRDFNTEALAYKWMNTHDRGLKGFVPSYHGSWVFDIDVPSGYGVEPQRGAVGLNLVEYIPGPSVSNLTADPHRADQAIPLIQEEYDPEYVTAVWSQLLEGIVRLEACGVQHNDQGTHNVIITPSPQKGVSLSKQAYPRVVIVDFAIVETNKHWITDLPVNPIDRCWDSLASVYEVLWPTGWEDAVQRRTWLFKQFGGNKAEEFAPLENSLADIYKEVEL